MEVPGIGSSGAGDTQRFQCLFFGMYMLGREKRDRENPERLCCRISPGQSHHLLMPYKTSPATPSQHKMPTSFDLPENVQTLLCFKTTLSWDQQCICGASSQSLLLFFIQEMPCQGRLSHCTFPQSSCPSQNHTQASVALMLGAGKATTQPSQNSWSPSTEHGVLHGHWMGEALAKDTLIHCPSQSVSHHTHGVSLQSHTRVANQ